MSSTPRPAADRRLKQAGVFLIALGVLCAALGAVPIIHALTSTFIDELSGPIYTAPFDASVNLKPGRYLLLESRDGSAQVMPAEVQVIDSTGTQLANVGASGGHNVVTRGNERFVDVVEFTADRAGRYRIYVAFPPNARLIVGRDPADAFSRVANWLLLGGAGLLLVVLGAVLLIAGLTRGRPSRSAPRLVYHGQPAGGQPPATPPGWYPDPWQPGASRYWDGYRWRP